MTARRLVAALFVFVAFLALAPAEATAQECGTWLEPVLCTGELQVRGEDGRWYRIDLREPLRVVPDGELELELTGRDQTGRTFPPSRLDLAADTRDCTRYLSVENRGEGRLRIDATRTEGRCRLDVWLPGNLNFAWRLEVEVAHAARTTYERDEAEFVAARLYRAILGREGDAGGLAGAVGEIQRGNLEAQIRAMLASDEFRRKEAGLDREALLAQFYRGLLDRDPDSTGIRTFTEDMQYRRWTAVLLGLIRSAEFEDRMLQR